MADGQFVCAALIAGVHGLGGPQRLRHLLLGQVVVLPEGAKPVQIHSTTTFFKADMQCRNHIIVKIFTVDYSKHLYYNKKKESGG